MNTIEENSIPPLLLNDDSLTSNRNIIQVNSKSGRYYTEEGKPFRYPSITRILGDDPAKKKMIWEWRNRVGSEEANKISSRASGKGTRAHGLIEHTIRKGKEDFVLLEKQMPHVTHSYRMLLKGLSIVADGVYDLERRMISHDLRIGGTVDCIGRMKNGERVIIDFKTSNKRKKREWISDYFIQCASYSEMFWDEFNIEISNLVVLIAVDDVKIPQIFFEKTEDWKSSLKTKVSDFYLRNPNFGVIKS